MGSLRKESHHPREGVLGASSNHQRSMIVIIPAGGLANTLMQPLRQLGNTSFAATGTSTWLLRGLTAYECAVPAGKTFALPATLMVGVTCKSRSLWASITPTTGPS
jgi:hypothetical protein